jgi:hypothetical protein
MNPDKLFDYLEDKLPAPERAALEERLMSDKQLQRELAVARQIHAGMRGDSREVLLPPQPDVTEQGRKMALRVGAAFMVLMVVNVGIGLWLIARHETKNPNRALLEKQMREQIANSLEHAAATFTPAPLGVSEVIVQAENWRRLPTKWSPSHRDSAVPLQKVSRTRAGLVFSSIFHQVASRNFAQRFRRCSGKRRRPQQPQLQRLPQPRRRVSLCKLSSNQQRQIDIYRF